MNEVRGEIRFDALMSIKYHRRRAAFLERIGMLMAAAILISGAGAFASILGSSPLLAQFLTCSIAIIGIIQIVFQVDKCAADHRGWMRRWQQLLNEIDGCETPTPTIASGWKKIQNEIEGECVGELRALQEDCLNRTTRMLNLCTSDLAEIKFHHRLFMQLYSFENSFQK